MKKLVMAFSVILVLLLIFGSATVSAASVRKTNVIIGFDRTPGRDEEALVQGFGGEIKFTYRMIPAIAASVPEDAIQGLMRNPRVTIVEPDVAIHAMEDSYPWGVTQIGADIVHGSGKNGSGVKIAILDTGIDYTHPELLPPIYAGGYDFVNGDIYPMDDNGHGTHVAGIIAAADNDSGIVGVAPGVQIYALKVLDSTGSGSFSNVIAALEWATGGSTLPGSIRVDITNNSYGSTEDPDYWYHLFFPGKPGPVETAFSLTYYQDGVLNVAAAGNSGSGSDTVIYPARYDSCIAVAATDSSNNRASFSSTGPKVELAAPGVNIYSTVPRSGQLGDPSGYRYLSGTSMATPHVTGAAALVRSSPEAVARDANHDGAYETNGDGTWTNVEIRNLLQATADDLGAAGRDNLYGYGLVDADEAVAIAPLAPLVAFSGAPTTGTAPLTVNFTDQSTGTAPLTYAWDFDNNGTVNSNVQNPSHVYSAAGTYTVKLTVSNTAGSDDEIKTNYITVNPAPVAPVAAFTGSPTSGTAPLTVNFTDQSTNAPTSWAWDFNNDGVVDSTVRNPSYLYSTAGTYTVTLTASNAAGSGEETKTDYITVTSPASITVRSPNGGNKWIIGTNMEITWTSTGIMGNVKIELSRDGGKTWKAITYDTANDGSYVWKVTSPTTTKAIIRISSVANANISDTSDAYFQIVKK